MENNNYWDGWDQFLYKLPDLLIALLVLFVGWLVAKMIEKGVYKALRKTNLDNRIFANTNTQRKYSSEKIISKIVYILLLVFVFILFFNILDLNIIASPLVSMLSSITSAIPSILKAALILLLAWLIATGLSFLIKKGGKTLRVHQWFHKLNLTKNNQDPSALVDKVAKMVFYLVLLLFLPGVLAALNIEGISGPFSNMLEGILEFLPNLFAAALILLIGWFVAKLVRDIVTNFLQTIGTEKLVERFGMKRLFEGTSLSSIVGTVVFVLILIPTVITALEKLNLKGISEPAISMLNDVLTMLPNIVVAIFLVLIGLWIGRWVNKFVTELLDRIGFNSFFEGMGFKKPNTTSTTTVTLSKIIGSIAQIFVVLLFVVEALNNVKLDFLVTLATGVIAYLPSVFAAVVIIVVGLFLGNLVKKLLESVLQGPHYGLLSSVAKFAIIAISIFMALDQLGVAASIVNAAFILILGGLALAFGLSFGLGGKEFANKYLMRLDQKIEETSVDKSKLNKNQNHPMTEPNQPFQQDQLHPNNQFNQQHPGFDQGSQNQNNFNQPNQNGFDDPNNQKF